MVINHGISTIYTEQHIKRQIILLVDLLFTRKDGENRKENRRGGYRCISMKLIKGQNVKRTGNMAPNAPLSTWSGTALGGAV
jgi:hypothetical protein